MHLDAPNLSWRQTIVSALASFLGMLWGWSQAIPWAAICGVVGTVVIPIWKLIQDGRVKARDRRIDELTRESRSHKDRADAAEAVIASYKMLKGTR